MTKTAFIAFIRDTQCNSSPIPLWKEADVRTQSEPWDCAAATAEG